ncbi:MAG: DUF3828 domain-containing protein [Bacteroidetes bacterium]|nr:DUF3828 domain-containing protein [Bacteroidota bacterium]
MKKIVVILSSLFCLFACKDAPANDSGTAASQTTNANQTEKNPDLIAIETVVHGFYAWYEAFQKDEKRNINFVSDENSHPKLDMTKLEEYIKTLQSSGFLSDNFISEERILWRKCEAAWQGEKKNEIHSCLDGDRFFCAQEWDLDFWTKANIVVGGLGTNHVKATMMGTQLGVNREQKFDLIKLGDKWFIDKIICDMGVN